MPYNQIQSLKSGEPAKIRSSTLRSPENRFALSMHCRTFPKRYPGINYISEQETSRRGQEAKGLPSKAWDGESRVASPEEEPGAPGLGVQAGGSGLPGETMSTGPQGPPTPFPPACFPCVTSSVPARPLRT